MNLARRPADAQSVRRTWTRARDRVSSQDRNNCNGGATPSRVRACLRRYQGEAHSLRSCERGGPEAGRGYGVGVELGTSNKRVQRSAGSELRMDTTNAVPAPADARPLYGTSARRVESKEQL